MADNKLTLRLTQEQQNQILNSTGKKISELGLDLAAKGHLTKEELNKVAGGGQTKEDEGPRR